jgi:hypothetical protein
VAQVRVREKAASKSLGLVGPEGPSACILTDRARGEGLGDSELGRAMGLW